MILKKVYFQSVQTGLKGGVIRTMQYYSALGRKKILTPVTTRMNSDHVMLVQ